MKAIAAAFTALTVTSATSYRWCDQTYTVDVGELTASIARCLYDGFSTVGGPQPTRHRATAGTAGRLSEVLDDANRGRGGFDSGWTVRGHDDTILIVERAGLHMWVEATDARFPYDADTQAVGQPVAVRRPAGSRWLTPGFYTAFGDQDLRQLDQAPLDRFYVHVGAADAVEFVRVATARLNRAALVFTLKVVDDPDGYDRCDTATVYARRTDRTPMTAQVMAIAARFGDRLEPAVPALTRQLARGVAFAEDPGDGRSFGQQRCALIAQAAVAAFAAGASSLEERLLIAQDLFLAAGVSPAEPWRHATQPLPIDVEGGVPCR